MATKAKPNETLVKLAADVMPDEPQPTSADRAYLRGLRKRGYSEQQIRDIAAKAKMKLAPDFFVPKKAKASAAFK